MADFPSDGILTANADYDIRLAPGCDYVVDCDGTGGTWNGSIAIQFQNPGLGWQSFKDASGTALTYTTEGGSVITVPTTGMVRFTVSSYSTDLVVGITRANP